MDLSIEMQIVDTKSINKFWNWFQTISINLHNQPTRTDLIDAVDSQVSLLGYFDWEIGPYNADILFLAISPNLNEDYLELTRQIIKLAPDCEGWVFLPSKPVKQWKGIFKMKNNLGKEILIDTNNWKYILYRFHDGVFDIDIQANYIDGDLDTNFRAIDIALTGYLGEETYMERIAKVTTVHEFENEIKNKLTLLPNIKKHIESL